MQGMQNAAGSHVIGVRRGHVQRHEQGAPVLLRMLRTPGARLRARVEDRRVDDDDRFAWRDLAPGDYGVMQSQCTQHRLRRDVVDPSIWKQIAERMERMRRVDVERDFDNEPEPFV
jgi:hypothetical protein